MMSFFLCTADSAQLLGMLIESAPYVVFSRTNLQRICRTLTIILADESASCGDQTLNGQTAGEPSKSGSPLLVPEGIRWPSGKGVVTSVLATTGTLAEHASRQLSESGLMDKLCELVVIAIRDKHCQNKQVQAVKTLGKVRVSTAVICGHWFWHCKKGLEWLSLPAPEWTLVCGGYTDTKTL